VYAVPSSGVQRLLRADLDTVRWVEGRRMLPLGGPPVPVIPLAEALGMPAGDPPSGKVPAVVLASGDRRAAVLVDEFLFEQLVLVKRLGERVRKLPHVTAATILPSGRVALMLSAGRLIDTALARPTGRGTASTGQRTVAKKRVLVAEDSVTTRTLQKTILETAGYEVLTAPDGLAAWRTLQTESVAVLVSDIDMPGLNGFELTGKVRSDARFAGLPVVLVTSRGSDEDKARGVEAGADAYVTKGGFDQTALLETIARLVG
jgi:two-component system, chemotaxis family, sensor kinase CheA